VGGVTYRITARPAGVTWDFGDGDVERRVGSAAFGVPFPAPSQVTHIFQAHSRLGYVIAAAVTYWVSWSALVAGVWSGPYPMGSVVRETAPLVYPVEQAQPEIVLMG